MSRPVLLLDLDGVVVFETRTKEERDILVLHKDIGSRLIAAEQMTFVLTHRSRREAEQILRASGIQAHQIVALLAAEDLFREACRHLRFVQLGRRGLQKSLALPLIEKISGRPREDVVLLDDRQHNLDAIIAAGAGLALKAPSALSDCGQRLTTFDLDLVLANIAQWHAERSGRPQRELSAVESAIEAWQRSGLSTHSHERHAFNFARKLAYSIRRAMFRGRNAGSMPVT